MQMKKVKTKVLIILLSVFSLLTFGIFKYTSERNQRTTSDSIEGNLENNLTSTIQADGTIVTTLKDIDELLLNPNKGYVGSVRETNSSSWSENYWNVINAGYVRFDFSDIATSEGVYNWDYIKNKINPYIQHNKKYAFGVMFINTSSPKEYVTPKWIFDKMPSSEKTTYNSGVRNYYIPRYDSTVFIDQVIKFHQASANYFKNDDNLLYMDVRVYGDYGENAYSRFEGAEATEEELLDLYLEPIVDIYKDTNIQLMFPSGSEVSKVVVPYLANNGVGVRRDSFLGDWFKKSYDITKEEVQKVPMALEMISTYASTLSNNYHNDEQAFKRDYEKYIKLTGASYMEFFSQMYDSDPEFYNRMGNLLGYWFRFQKASYKVETKDSITTLNGIFEFKNDGVSSLYNDADVYVGVFDKNDNLVKKVKTNIDPKEWKAKQWNEENWEEENTTIYTEDVNITIGELEDGEYKLALGLFGEEDVNDPSYKFGSEGIYNGNWYLFGNINVNNIKEVKNIKVNLPTKIIYVKGEELDLTGGSLTVTYEDGSEQEIPMTAEGIEVQGYESLEEGEQTLTVVYKGKTANFTVNVVASKDEETNKDENLNKDEETEQSDNAVIDEIEVKQNESTTVSNILPNTGEKKKIFIVTVITIFFAIISYVKYRKYKKIC